MALRPVSELGLADATDVEPLADDRPAPPRQRTPERRRATRRSPSQSASNGTTPAKERPAARSDTNGTPPQEASDRALKAHPEERPEVPLADEPTTFLQIMVPGELHQRLADVSYALAPDHRKLRHHKTILGALVWRYVRPDDPEALRHLGAALDAYLATDIAEAPAEIKAGAHLPFSLKHRVDGAALVLRRTRRDASGKTLLSALIWRHVDRNDVAPLVELLHAYYDVVRPRPIPLS
jgi:hypothetical protein